MGLNSLTPKSALLILPLPLLEGERERERPGRGALRAQPVGHSSGSSCGGIQEAAAPEVEESRGREWGSQKPRRTFEEGQAGQVRHSVSTRLRRHGSEGGNLGQLVDRTNTGAQGLRRSAVAAGHGCDPVKLYLWQQVVAGPLSTAALKRVREMGSS